MTKVSKDFHFCAGHRLAHHEGHCFHLHGHNYMVRVTVGLTLGGSPAAPHHMVLDFGHMGPLKDWIDAELDHAMILAADDEAGLAAVEAWEEVTGRKHRLFLTDGQPTAELLSELIKLKAQELLFSSSPTVARVEQVSVWETPRCFATSS